MNLDYLTQVAGEFAKMAWPLRKQVGLIDFMIYGSVVRKEKDPKDLDILIIHKNPELDKFQNMIKEKIFSSDTEEFLALEKILNINLSRIFQNSSIPLLLSKGLLHTSYLNHTYFTNRSYRKRWDLQNLNPDFLKGILKEGMLWNSRTEKYDIPTLTRYNLLKAA